MGCGKLQNNWKSSYKVMVPVLILLIIICKTSSGEEDCSQSRPTLTGSRPHRSAEQKLLSDLLHCYDKEARPVLHPSDAINVTFKLKLVQVVEVSEKDQTMRTNVWVTQTWTNTLLTWDPREYNNISVINIEAHNLWVPTIILYNNAEETFSGGRYKFKTKVIIDNTGHQTWFAAASFRSSCKFDIRNFPFDEQECRLIFGSWAYSIDKLDIFPATLQGDLSDYIPSGEWEMIGLPAKKKIHRYPCCERPFAEVVYKVRMRRKVLYYLFNLILPCTIIASLALLAFCIPPMSGQRVTLSITVMLAMSVFLNFAWTRLPVTSESVPLLAKYYMLTMVEIGMSLFANCIALNYFYRDNALSYLPHCCRVAVLGWLAKLVASLFCMRHPDETSRLSKMIKEYSVEDDCLTEYDHYRNTEYDSFRTLSAQVHRDERMCGKAVESVVTIMDSGNDDNRWRQASDPKVKVSHIVKRKQRKPLPFKKLFLHEILKHTSTHALVAEPHQHYKQYKEYRQNRDEDDVDVLVGNTVENALLSELEDIKQFTALIVDRFFLVVFLITIALSFTALLSGDTSEFVLE